ncbi:isoaspartyl peptidase/L-asparaginase [Massilia sp. W12]|uniref:isoaspartyl peptidase/L-asparaginase family protein n=1 Tax=Massilia sp. W12 TaxID=3126507 RepID=UPI0030CFD20D
MDMDMGTEAAWPAGRFCLALHGGAGTIVCPEVEQAAWHAALQSALEAGRAVLAADGSAQAAVVATVQALEDCPLFNAGRGAVYDESGSFSLDACVMEGAHKRAGAIAGAPDVANPVLLAQAVLEEGFSVLLGGAGAQAFARAQGFAAMPAEYFATAQRYAQWQAVRGGQAASELDHDAAARLAQPLREDGKLGTVGAVARDRAGNLAAATSTGGMTNKRLGRIGDSPLVGAGCYAENGVAAISCTGTGEHFIRSVLAHQVACRMRFGGQDLSSACAAALAEMQALGGQGGLIAIDAAGRISLPFTTRGMYRAWLREGEMGGTGIF